MEKIDFSQCTKCDKYKECTNVGLSEVSTHSEKVMIVLDHISTQCSTEGIIISRTTELDLLSWVLTDVVNIRPQDVYFAYAVKCPSDTKPTPKEIKACAENLHKEIAIVRPKAIITMGEIAMQAVCQTKNLTKWAGKIQTIVSLGETMKGGAPLKIPVVATYSIEAVQKAQKKLLKSFARHIDKGRNIAFDIPEMSVPTKIVMCDTLDKIDTLIEYCKVTKMCCFDFETKELVKEQGTFEIGFYATTLSISFQIGSAYVIPLEHFDSPYSRERVLQIMEKLRLEIFENPEIRKVAHNLKFDWHVLQVYGYTELRGRLDDTMLQHHLHDETTLQGLKFLVDKYLPEFSGYDDEVKGMNWADIPLRMLAQYNGVDTDATLRLCTLFEVWLQKDERVYTVYRNLSMGVFRCLWQAEHIGMLIDVPQLKESIAKVQGMLQRKDEGLRNHSVVQAFEKATKHNKLEGALDEAQKKLSIFLKKKVERIAKNLKKKYETLEAWKLKNREKPTFQSLLDKKIASLEQWKADQKKPDKSELNYRQKIKDTKEGTIEVYTGINFASPTQMGSLLYYEPAGFKFDTLTGGTGKDVILDLKDSTGFVDQLLNYRSLKTTLGTYMIGLLKRVDTAGRIHTSFKIHGTVTGRLASANPNLQNLPSISRLKDVDCIEAVKLIKSAFIIPVDHIITQGDYSQMELRLMAVFSKEPNMIQTYLNDEDLHAKGAATMLRIALEDFYKLDSDTQKSARTRAKARNFGFIYGMGAKGFLEYAKNTFGVILTLQEAEKERAGFFKMYPKILDYHDEYIQKGAQYGWVRTLLGRKRNLPNINHPDNFLRGCDERYSINSPIQGTGGEFTIFSLALLYLRLDPRVQIVNTIHDSIILYIPNDLIEYTLKILKYTCEKLPLQQFFNKSLGAMDMKLDIEVSTKSWKDLKEYEGNLS